MARRKDSTKAKSAASRTTASVFQNYNPEESIQQLLPQPTPKEPQQAQNDDPQNYRFPINIIYELLDFLVNNADFCKGVQVMTLLYIGQIAYLYLKNTDNWAAISAIGFSLLGSVLAVVFNQRSQWRKHKSDPEYVPKPLLPEFNIIYAFFIPILLAILLGSTSSPFFQVNLSLNNFAITRLNIVAKIMSSFVFYYMYNENSTLEVIQFARVVAMYFCLQYALDYWNELPAAGDGTGPTLKTMLAAEIHIVCAAMVNLLFNFSTRSLPLVIFRELVLSLAAALVAAFQVHWAYKKMSAGVAKKFVAVTVVLVFAGVFYYVTDLQFRREVDDENPVVWLVTFILESRTRFRLMAFWVGALVTTVPVVFGLAYTNKISLNMRRKIWHFLLVACLLNRYFTAEADFVAIALLGSVVVFLVLEMVRVTRLTFIGEFLFTELRFFQDEKDLKGPLNLSYIFLLVGVAFPLAYGFFLEDVVSLRSYLGLVMLGLGDSVASIVGKKLGRNKWRGGDRTIEGSLAFVVVTFSTLVAVDAYLLPEPARVNNWENVFIVVLVAGLLEGSATLNDNVLIPCVLTLLYDVLSRTF